VGYCVAVCYLCIIVLGGVLLHDKGIVRKEGDSRTKMIRFVAYKTGVFDIDGAGKSILFDTADGGCSNDSPCFELPAEEWSQLGQPDAITITIEAGDGGAKKD
jgi:hypothetical protein